MKKFDKTEARKFAKEISKKKGTDLADDLRRNMKKFQANERILKEYIAGETAFDLVRRDAMLPAYLEQVEAMCALLYPANTNIDYFPTNFVLRDGTLWYIDYECNDFMAEWSFENWGVKYWSKTPEFLAYLREHA